MTLARGFLLNSVMRFAQAVCGIFHDHILFAKVVRQFIRARELIKCAEQPAIPITQNPGMAQTCHLAGDATHDWQAGIRLETVVNEGRARMLRLKFQHSWKGADDVADAAVFGKEHRSFSRANDDRQSNRQHMPENLGVALQQWWKIFQIRGSRFLTGIYTWCPLPPVFLTIS